MPAGSSTSSLPASADRWPASPFTTSALPGTCLAWCGGTLETGIGRGFNLALAALPGFTLHSDMSPARIFYEQDLVEPTFDVGLDESIAVPARAGNGFPVVPERVAGERDSEVGQRHSSVRKAARDPRIRTDTTAPLALGGRSHADTKHRERKANG